MQHTALTEHISTILCIGKRGVTLPTSSDALRVIVPSSFHARISEHPFQVLTQRLRCHMITVGYVGIWR